MNSKETLHCRFNINQVFLGLVTRYVKAKQSQASTVLQMRGIAGQLMPSTQKLWKKLKGTLLKMPKT